MGACIGVLIGGALGVLAGLRRGWAEDIVKGAVDIRTRLYGGLRARLHAECTVDRDSACKRHHPFDLFRADPWRLAEESHRCAPAPPLTQEEAVMPIYQPKRPI